MVLCSICSFFFFTCLYLFVLKCLLVNIEREKIIRILLKKYLNPQLCDKEISKWTPQRCGSSYFAETKIFFAESTVDKTKS